MRNINKYLKLGLLFYTMFLLGNFLNILPEFLKGLLVGLGITLMLIGLYNKKHDIFKLKNYKRTIIKKTIKK